MRTACTWMSWSALLVPLAAPACIPSGGGDGGAGVPLQPSIPDVELIFAHARPGGEHSDSQIRGALADGLGERKLIDVNGFERRTRIAPDGIHLVFARRRRSNDATSQELFVGTVDGSAPEFRLTNDSAVDDEPCWSPDGNRVVFASDRLGAGMRLFRVDATGANLITLFDDGAELSAPDWGAASNRIAFARQAASGRSEIWTIRPDGTDAARLTDGGLGLGGPGIGGDREPCWSPDGHTILFARTLDAAHAILAAVEFATGVVTPWLLPAPIAAAPRFSPRGDRVFFTAADPATGVTVLRVHSAHVDGTAALMIAPDSRYDVVGVDCSPRIGVASSDPLVWSNVVLESAVVSNLYGHRTGGLFDYVLEDDGVLLTITTLKQGSIQLGGLELTFQLGVVSRDVAAIEVTVEAAVSEVEAATRLRLTLADYVAQRHATMVFATPTSTSANTFTYVVGGLRCVDRNGDARVSVVAEKDIDTPGELSIDHVSLRVLHIDRR